MNLLEARNLLAKNEITEKEAALALGMSLEGLREELERWGKRVTKQREIIDAATAIERDKALKQAADIIKVVIAESKAGGRHG